MKCFVVAAALLLAASSSATKAAAPSWSEPSCTSFSNDQAKYCWAQQLVARGISFLGFLIAKDEFRIVVNKPKGADAPVNDALVGIVIGQERFRSRVIDSQTSGDYVRYGLVLQDRTPAQLAEAFSAGNNILVEGPGAQSFSLKGSSAAVKATLEAAAAEGIDLAAFGATGTEETNEVAQDPSSSGKPFGHCAKADAISCLVQVADLVYVNAHCPGSLRWLECRRNPNDNEDWCYAAGLRYNPSKANTGEKIDRMLLSSKAEYRSVIVLHNTPEARDCIDRMMEYDSWIGSGRLEPNFRSNMDADGLPHHELP